MSNNVIPKITQLSNQEMKARAMVLSFLSLGIPFETAKQCALIAVEEIIKGIEVFGYSGTFYDDPETGEMVCNDEKSPVNYWNQVKTEIEKL